MKKVFFMVALFGATIFLSCHKSNHSTSIAAGCKLTGVHVKGNGWEGNYVISYNDAGKLSTVQYADNSSSYTRSFAYTGNQILITTAIGSAVASRDTVFFDANGDVDHIVSQTGQNDVAIDSFTYDGNRQLAKSVFTSSLGVKTTTFQYSDGDMIAEDADNLHIVYSYYTDKTAAMGDLFVLGQFLQYGAQYEKSRHLSKSETTGSIVENLSYTFDTQGKITGGTQTSGSEITTFTYTYTCD